MNTGNEDYDKGYKDGLTAGFNIAMSGAREPMSIRQRSTGLQSVSKKSTSRKQSKKQKLLTSMTAKKWKSYSKGSGRKTYVEIRSQVSRSNAYKSKAKKL